MIIQILILIVIIRTKLAQITGFWHRKNLTVNMTEVRETKASLGGF